MRLNYRSLTRPKHVARRIHTIFPALSLSTAQNWTAQLMGYRNWHELSDVSATYDGEETKDIHIYMTDTGVENQEELTTLFNRSSSQEEVLMNLVGVDVVDLPGMFFVVDPNHGGFPFKKLGTVGKGRPFFRGLAYDLYDYESEGPPGEGAGKVEDVGIGEDAPYIYIGLPEGVDEAEFYGRLLRNLGATKRPYRNYDKDAKAELTEGPFGKSILSLEDWDGAEEADDPEQSAVACKLAAQSRRMRLFLMSGDEPCGFAVVTTNAVASGLGTGLSFEIIINEAACAFDDNVVTDTWVSSVAMSVSGAVTRALWFRVANKDKAVAIDVQTESESPLAWAIAEGVCEMLPDIIGDADAHGLAEVTFYATVAP